MDNGPGLSALRKPLNRRSRSMFFTTEHLHANAVEHFHPSEKFSFRNFVAFWATVCSIMGSLLFFVGSISMYPGVLPDAVVGDDTSVKIHGYRQRAMVDYAFMIGAWYFLCSNYLIYAQVINKNSHGEEGSGLRFFAMPSKADLHNGGYLSCIFNLIGSVLFIPNTMAMFGADESTTFRFNMWYVMTGAGGSLFFALGAICEGEYNEWRKSGMRLEKLMSYINFFSGMGYFMAYAVYYNHYVDDLLAAGQSQTYIWATCSGFTAGSVGFTITSWMCLYMWKSQKFGLSFQNDMVGEDDEEFISDAAHPDFKQQIMIAIYCCDLVFLWVWFGFIFQGMDSIQAASEGLSSVCWTPEMNLMDGCNKVVKILIIHMILLLASAIHHTPKMTPFGYLLWGMRVIAILSFCESAHHLYHLVYQTLPSNAL